MNFSIYSASTGAVLCTGSADPESWALQIQPNTGILPVDVPSIGPEFLQYVDLATGQLNPRPTLALSKTTIAADGVDAAVLDPAPSGTEVFLGRVTGISQGVLDESGFEFVAIEPGVYRFRFAPPFPFMPLEIEVTAT